MRRFIYFHSHYKLFGPIKKPPGVPPLTYSPLEILPFKGSLAIVWSLSDQEEPKLPKMLFTNQILHWLLFLVLNYCF